MPPRAATGAAASQRARGSWFSRTWAAGRYWAHFIWIYVNKYLWTNKVWRRKNPLHREILVVGDETALGFGDWVVCSQTPGYAKFLCDEIACGGGKGTPEVRFRWNVFSTGHIGATSDDWLPQDPPQRPAKPRKLPWLVWRSLFEDAFGEAGRFAECECVILHVGFHDEHSDPARTAANCMTIAEELLRRGKRVWVSLLPTRCESGISRGWLLAERNQAIRAAVEGYGHPHLQVGLDLENLVRRPELFSWDGVHLSRRGYQKVARETYKLMRWPLVNIEFCLLHPTQGDAQEGGSDEEEISIPVNQGPYTSERQGSSEARKP